jgi:hypothetical protein
MSKLVTVGTTALFACILSATPLSFHLSRSGNVTLSTDTASAVIGRPLTPMSVAGVHRRAERRAYRRGYYGYGAYNNPYRYGYGTYQPYSYGYGTTAYGWDYGTTAYRYGAYRPYRPGFRYGYANQPWFGSGSSSYPYQQPWWTR